MTKETTRWRILVILLFAITFTLVGWMAPVIYATYVPQEQVIDVHEFTAQNTTTTADNHHICFDRKVQNPLSAETFTELYIINENERRIDLSSDSNDRYFQGGNLQTITKYALPNNLTSGVYKYVLVAKIDMSAGRVTRTFAFESEPFRINDSIQLNESRAAIIERCGG